MTLDAPSAASSSSRGESRGGLYASAYDGLLPGSAATAAERSEEQVAAPTPAGRDRINSAPAGVSPESWSQISAMIGSGQDVQFMSASEAAANGTEPDYILGADGRLTRNPAKTTPPADGKVTIGVQSSGGDEASKQAARQLQVAAVQEKIAYWRSDPRNRGSADIPEFLKGQLAAAQAAAGPGLIRDDDAFNRLRMPEAPGGNQPDAQQTPAPAGSDAPSSPGGSRGSSRGGSPGGSDAGSPGGSAPSFAGRNGFDNNGMYQGSSNPNEGNVWTGGSDRQGQPVGPGEQAHAKDIYDFFIEKGLTPAQASGILGNIQTESNFRTNAHNPGEGAIGLCQWEGPRRTALESFAAERGKPVTDMRTQLDFIWHELNTSERGALAALRAAQTPEQAAQAFQSRYERSASLGPRAANAANFHAMFAGNDRGNTPTA